LREDQKRLDQKRHEPGGTIFGWRREGLNQLWAMGRDESSKEGGKSAGNHRMALQEERVFLALPVL
jgi:hypothetical protein